MGEYTLPLLMILGLMCGIFTGYPVAFVLAGLGILFSFIADVPFLYLGSVVNRTFTGVIGNWLLLAVPLFVFMGLMLEKSGLAKNLLLSLERLFVGMRGGLAVSVALLGIVMAASTGIIGASVVMLAMLSLPVMMKQGYDKSLAVGTVCAAGTLGILIPPSIMLVLVGDILRISVGDLFTAAILPGLLLGVIYIGYIIAVAVLQPHKAPVNVIEDDSSRLSIILQLVQDLIAPILLIMGVLGSIIAGIATPTEAAAVGAAGTILLAAINRTLNLETLRTCVYETGKTSAMILFVAIGATCFSSIFKRIGGEDMIFDATTALGTGPYGTLIVLMLIIFILGFFLEWIEISYVVLPLFAPIVATLEFGLDMHSGERLVWFAILVAVNLQTSFLTPPFGYALFYLKGVAPPEISMKDIYSSILPFVLLQLVGLAFCLAFPSVILWLPRVLG